MLKILYWNRHLMYIITKKHTHADFKLISFYGNEWGYISHPPDFTYVPGGPWCKIKQIVNEKVKRISAVTVRSHKRKSIT